MEELESTSVETNDVSSSEASQPEVTQQAEPAASGNDQGSQPLKESAQVDVPFHSHPRFQELISQKNEMASRLNAYERQINEQRMQLQELTQRLPKQQPAENPMYKRLEEIDKDFAQYIRGIEDRASKYETVESKLQQVEKYFAEQEQQKLVSEYQNKMSSLHNQYKATDQVKDLIEMKVETEILRNPNITLSQVDQLYKSAYEAYSNRFKEFERSITQKYVVDKKKDQVPASQTGGAPAKNLSSQKPMTKQDAIDQMVKELRAAKQAI